MKKYTLLYLMMLLFMGASAQNDTIVFYNFGNACAAPPAGWQNQNVDGSCAWRCSDGGITQNNHSSQGCSNAANDWLITPRLALKGYKNEVLNFNTTTQYSGGALTIEYSTNYPGTGSPVGYTWTTLVTASAGFSGNISMANINSDSVYLAFHYTSTGNGTGQAARWTVLDMIVKGTKSLYTTNPTVRAIDSSSAILGAEVVSDVNTTVLQRGVIWSTSNNPTLLTPGANRIIKSGTAGVFDTLVNMMPSGTQIYFRGYAYSATDTSYTNVAAFYTLAGGPTSHATNFTATTLSERDIVLNWNAVPDATGYVILQRQGAAPTGIPVDAVKYNKNQILGDAIVADTIFNGSVQTDTIRNLYMGTRYYFSLIPLKRIGTNNATLNYYTEPVIPVANDSTWGVPASSLSDIIAIAGSESQGISTLINTASITAATHGEQVWKIMFRDGGAAGNDADNMPTQFTGLKIYAGTNNTISNWANATQAVALIDDSTGAPIGTLTVNAQNMTITNLALTVADNNVRTATLRLSLDNLVAQTENNGFHFVIPDTAVTTASSFSSSQKQSFVASSDSTKNKIRVSATKIRMIQQPPALAEAGVAMADVIVELTDIYNNVDIDTTLSVSVNATAGNLANAPVVLPANNGRAAFKALVFNTAANADTLVFSTGNLALLKSNRFKVKNGSLSDIIPTASFIYTSNIPYEQYTDSIALTTGNSVPVFGFTIRDLADADTASTILTSFKLTITNDASVKTLALFDSSLNKIAEMPVTGSVMQFSGLNIVTADGTSQKMIVAATFKKQVTDKARVQFSFSEAIAAADTASSLFAAANAGGAVSSTLRDENRIAVTGTKLRFVQQPVNTAVGSAISPSVTIEAVDTNDNKDADASVITLSATKGTLDNSSVIVKATNPVSAQADFTQIIFADTVTAVQLVATSGTLTAVSDTFDVYQPLWFRSVKTGDWDSVNTWEYSNDNGGLWMNAIEMPNALKHGKIVISAGHTVTMRGTVEASRTLNETVIEAGATLVTPVNANQAAIVTDGPGNDLEVYGTLKHTNASVQSMIIHTGANIEVMNNAIVDLTVNGNAMNWAGNTQIRFHDAATYIHRSTLNNSIPGGVYFPNTDANDKPVFRAEANLFYPAAGSNTALTINGVFEAKGNISFSNDGINYFRNGITGDGNISFSGNTRGVITADAVIGGNGTIQVNGQAMLEMAAGSYTSLLSNKTINTNTQKGLNIKGSFNTRTYSISGNASIHLDSNGTLITAHSNGVKGALATGYLNGDDHAKIVLNKTDAAQQVNTPKAFRTGTLVISNPHGVTLTDTLLINDSLNLQNGILHIAANGLIVLNENAIATNGAAGRFINGRVKAAVTKATTLPIGKDNTYSPVTLTPSSANNGVFTAEYFNAIPSAFDANAITGSLKRTEAGKAWYIHTPDQAAVTISVSYAQLPLQAAEDAQDIRLAQWKNNQWVSVGPYARNSTMTGLTTDALIPSGYFALAIDSSCTPAAAPVVTTDTACFGGSVNLNATGTNIFWYTDLTSVQAIAQNNLFNTGTLTHDTFFYAEAKNRSCPSTRVKVNVKVAPVPAAAQVLQNSIAACGGRPVTLEATATEGTIKWYGSLNSTTAIASGNTFVTGHIFTDSVIYAAASLNGCVSARTPVTITAKTTPAKPFAKNIDVCKGNPATLIASTNATTIKWYSSSNATTAFYTGTYFTTAVLNSDTGFYAEAYNGTCSSERIAVAVTALNTPALPVLNTLGFACKGEPVNIVAASADTIRWYLSERDSAPVFKGSSYTTAPLNRQAVFFVDAYDGHCASAKLSYTVNVVNKPAGLSIHLPSTVKRTDSIAVELDGPAADEYTWNFGTDAVPAVATGRGPHYIKWYSNGVKQVSITVTNRMGPFACENTFDTVITVTPATGVAESASIASAFDVYPNPANSVLNISVELTSRMNGSVKLADLTGRIVWEDLLSNTGSYNNSISVQDMAAGMYLLYIEADNQHISKKVIIHK